MARTSQPPPTPRPNLGDVDHPGDRRRRGDLPEHYLKHPEAGAFLYLHGAGGGSRTHVTSLENWDNDRYMTPAVLGIIAHLTGVG